MKYPLLLVALALACDVVYAADTTGKLATPLAPVPSAVDLKSPHVTAVTSSGRGQAGYVHYFLITHQDASLEYHVGIELEDQRVAWSFPNAGVMVSEFIKNGTVNANGKDFKIEHLHGVRPFADDAQMRALQKALPQRVAQWVDNETPYCFYRIRGEPFCLSCGDFAVRILYPGAHPLVPALPQDFLHASGAAPTTNDLLLYLVGVNNLPGKPAQLARLAALDLPANMRDDIIAMIEDGEPYAPHATAAASQVPLVATASLAASPTASPPKPTPSRIASRRTQNKKL